MKDDALAPVIAVMLILAAIVTFFSIYNTIYIPSMKESSEVEHLQNVESAFQHFTSDIDYAASSHQDHLTFSEPVQLGGGDITFNLLKSSGTLNVQDETNPIYTLSLTDRMGTPVAFVNGTMVNFSYEPTSNFWQDQGYQWQHGYINVTKDGNQNTAGVLQHDRCEQRFHGIRFAPPDPCPVFSIGFLNGEYVRLRNCRELLQPRSLGRNTLHLPGSHVHKQQWIWYAQAYISNK